VPRQHELSYQGPERSGAEIWHCWECGHRLRLPRQSRFEWEIVAAGDQKAVHTADFAAVPSGYTLRGPAAVLTSDERSWLDESGIDWTTRAA
jgi:hypothetical protein